MKRAILRAYRAIGPACLVALLPIVSLSARTIHVLELAYEVRLSDVSLPGSTVGILRFTSCEACEARALPVTPNTVYETPEGVMPLAEFAIHIAEIRMSTAGNGEPVVTVFRKTDNEQVTRVRLGRQP